MAKPLPVDAETLSAVTAAVRAAWEAGCPIAPSSAAGQRYTARITIRRWRSSARRGVDQSDRAARVRDLAKGLVDQTGTEPKSLGPLIRDFEYLADEAAKAL
jgi:hypothetical protein